MIKTLSNILKQDREAFVIPKKVQDMIPIQTIWPDGIFLNGKNKFSKMYRFTDINYAAASRGDKEGMFLECKADNQRQQKCCRYMEGRQK